MWAEVFLGVFYKGLLEFVEVSSNQEGKKRSVINL